MHFYQTRTNFGFNIVTSEEMHFKKYFHYGTRKQRKTGVLSGTS
jgi:hypothetical protein